MNGFLVVLSHTMDDLPIRLCGTKKQAEKVANETSEMPADEIRRVFSTDCSTPCNVSIVTYRKGHPVDCEVVKNFTE